MSRVTEIVSNRDYDEYETRYILKTIKCDLCLKVEHRLSLKGIEKLSEVEQKFHQFPSKGWMYWGTPPRHDGSPRDIFSEATTDYCPTCARVIDDLICENRSRDPEAHFFYEEEETAQYNTDDDPFMSHSDFPHVLQHDAGRISRCSYCEHEWLPGWETTECPTRAALHDEVAHEEHATDRLEDLAADGGATDLERASIGTWGPVHRERPIKK